MPYGTVGNVGLLVDRESSFTQLDVANALAKIGRGKSISVRINSGGGIATGRLTIYNSLAAWSGKVTVAVQSIAASAASINRIHAALSRHRTKLAPAEGT